MNWKSMVPAVVATVLVGGGVALAAETVPTEPDPITTEEVVPSPQETPVDNEGAEDEGSEGESGTEQEGTESAEPESAAAVAAPECPEGVRNHGEYVSGVAKSEERRALSGAERGALMAAAAQTDCGKQVADDTDSESAEEEGAEVENSDVDSDDEPKANKSSKAEKKAAKSAKGNGKGRGKSGRS